MAFAIALGDGRSGVLGGGGRGGVGWLVFFYYLTSEATIQATVLRAKRPFNKADNVCLSAEARGFFWKGIWGGSVVEGEGGW